jgi:sulfur carrier protein
MDLQVNGKRFACAPGTTVADIVDRVVGPARRKGVAVAINDEVVPRSEWGRELVEGDRIELVKAIQGG